MKRTDELVSDLELLIKEHYELERVIEENTKLRDAIDKIKDEIVAYKRSQLAYVTISVSDLQEGKRIALESVLAIIDKYIKEHDDEECLHIYADGQVWKG